MAVVYEWGPSCYILYHRTSVEQYSLKQALECCEDNVRVQEITAQKLAETKKHLLAQLLRVMRFPVSKQTVNYIIM